MISSAFLNRVAHYVDSQIAKIVLNGHAEVTDFTARKIKEHVLTLNYIVKPSVTTLVKQIEIKDKNENVISSNTVNIPITVDHFMVQTIEIKGVTT